MPRALLHSQFEALEEPGPDENAVIASIEPEPREIVAQILALLHLTAALEQEPLRSSALGRENQPVTSSRACCMTIARVPPVGAACRM